MLKRAKEDNKSIYICKECGFAYKTKELAQKCGAWCKEHHSCNIEITKYAIDLNQD